MKRSFGDVYRNKRILITGHTGFKGSWLSTWLLELGAEVSGFSLDVPTNPSNFEVLGLKRRLKHITGDVRNLKQLEKAFDRVKPEIVFHLAAQAITRQSYEDPQATLFTNAGGTVNVLECIRRSGSVSAAVFITSDKCYQNVEWIWGYRENDRLGGDDPYSASKACAEITCQSYIKSFFQKRNSPRVSTARAGNVIGGGDWAIDRIIPDCIRAFSKKKKLEIRSPSSTRPWQHVLEPLSGYLWLGANLYKNNKIISGESFNFGPQNIESWTVKTLITEFVKRWGHGKWSASVKRSSDKKEATLLKLNCDKALARLKWQAILSFSDTVRFTAEWYKAYNESEDDMYDLTVGQIEEYTENAVIKKLAWSK